MKLPRVDWLVLVVAALLIASCSGGGCSGCGGCGLQPIPGGFAPGKRTANAAQARVSQTGLAAITANPAALIDSLAGGTNGVIAFNVPASCGGSTPICCPGGVAQNPCGPINIDISQHTGDSPRLVLAPQQGASELDVTVKARLSTVTAIPVNVPVFGDCTVTVDTTQGSVPDVTVALPIDFTQDATAATTRIAAGTVTLTNLESADVSLGGSIACDIADLGLSFFLSLLESQLTSPIESAINGATCKACPGGTTAECGSSFATACTNNVCMEGANCLEELGLEGRAVGTAVFGSFSPGTTGAMDLYEVAGGYATTNTGGIALGLLGGMEPAGAPRDQCGPPTTEPAPISIPQSAYFSGNTRPDTGDTFDIGIGIHKSQLSQLAYAGYNGGLFCLTVGHDTVSQLTTDTIGLVSRSLTKLVATASPMAVGLRPQSPPVITLGANTFTTDTNGNPVVADPALDIKFTGMELDFFAAVDEQYVRVFTVVADVHLPVGLQTSAMGKLTPVIGAATDAFTNISVKNSDAVTESPDDLAQLFPSILGLVLPQLSSGLGSIALPAIGNLNLDITAITDVDNASFLAIYANLVPSSPTPPMVETSLVVTSIVEPPAAIMKSPRQWAAAQPPRVQLELGGDAGNLEYSIRLDHGTWSAWSPNPRPTLSPKTFWLAGVHHIEARARVIGHADTIDLTPAETDITIGADAVPQNKRNDFHGQAGTTGCVCNTGNASPGGFAPIFVALGVLALPRSRRRRIVRAVRRALPRLGLAVWAVALFALHGCGCNNKPCGDSACLPGDIARGAIGRFTSIAGDDKRVMVATYDQVLGDLVAVDATDTTNLTYVAVDGIPTDVTPTHDPSSYRGGIADAGPDVGAWTSIALANHIASVAYQDRDATALKYAAESSAGGSWSNYVIDAPAANETIGSFANMVIDMSGNAAIAYLAVGVDDGAGHRATELRLARATSATPQSVSDWTTGITIASGPGTCAGLCGAGETCVESATAGDPQSCVAATNDCSPGCGSGDVCNAGACVTEVAAPATELDDIPTGTGLFVSMGVMSDGRLVAAYYDRNARALVLGVESAANTNQFTPTVLDGNVALQDRGMWASAAVADDGTVHIAYQDAIGDQLMYTTWNGTPGVPVVVDDGERTGDRTHPVGSAAALYLDNGSPTIAYQDGMVSDIYLATLSGATWTTTPLVTGPLLDGFSLAATTGHGSPVLAWDELTPANDPPNALVVQAP